MREIVEAVKRAIPDASSQPPGAVLQYAKNVAGLVLAVLTIVSRPSSDQTSARSRRKPAEKAWRASTGDRSPRMSAGNPIASLCLNGLAN